MIIYDRPINFLDWLVFNSHNKDDVVNLDFMVSHSEITEASDVVEKVST